MRECISCGKSNWKTFRNFDLYSGEWLELYECRGCGHGITNFSNYAELKKYYPKAYYGQKSKRFFPLIETAIQIFRSRRANAISKMRDGKLGRILDIGCGRGLTIANLKRKGWDVWGTEFSSDSSEAARESLGDRLVICEKIEDLPIQKNSCDVITLWHVFEHIPNPAEMVKSLKNLLARDGFIIIEVPNFQGWQSFIARPRWLYLEAPRHLHHFSQKSLANVFEREGMNATLLGTGSMEFGVFGMLQSLLNVLPMPPNFLFNFLKRKSARDLGVSKAEYAVDAAVSLSLAVILFPLALVLEGVAILFGKGSCLRVVVRNQSGASANG